MVRRRYSADRLHFLELDCQALPFKKSSFDVVTSLDTIEHVKEWEQFLAECKRVLKPGGLFICSTPNIDGHFFLTKAVLTHGFLLALVKRIPPLYRLLINPFHLHEFSEQEFRAAIGKFFTGVDLYGYRWGMPNPPRLSRLPVLGPMILEAYKFLVFSKALFAPEPLVSLDQLDDWEEFVRDFAEPFPLGKKASYCDAFMAVAKAEAD